MHRLLIVDDEPVIADGLYDIIQKLEDVELDVYKAYSGNEAIELLGKMRIDIVVTDICMPEIDGLQLLDIIRGNWPECRVIFITGHNVFDYVYNAIQHHGVRFLLKTEKYEKIIRTIKETVLEVEQSFNTRDLMSKARYQMSAAKDLQYKEYFSVLLKGKLTGDQIKKYANEIEIPLNTELPVIMILGRMDNVDNDSTYTEKREKFHAVKLIIEQHLIPYTYTAIFTSDFSDLILKVQPGSFFTNSNSLEGTGVIWDKTFLFIKETLENVQQTAKRTLELSLSFSMDSRTVAWDMIAVKYDFLKFLMDYYVGMESEMIVTESNHRNFRDRNVQTSDVNYLFMQSNKLELLKSYIERGMKKEYMELFYKLTKDLRNIKSKNSHQALEVYFSISTILLSFMNRFNLIEKVAFKTGLRSLTAVDDHSTWSDAVAYLNNLSCILIDEQFSEKKDRTINTVDYIKKYINENLSDDISLIKLSNLVYFNPEYLSRMFRNITGMKLSDYISEIKYSHAKRLLEDNSVKVQDIAKSVGYNSATNFTRFFRTMSGITPQEYRESLVIYNTQNI